MKSKAEPVDWLLEVRLMRAIAYAKSKSGKLARDPNTLAVFEHPALAWVKEEAVSLPRRYFPHPQAPGLRTITPNTHAAIAAVEKRTGVAFAPALRDWFTNIGALDLRGTHPFLNPGGSLDALEIWPLKKCAATITAGAMNLNSQWQVRIADGRLTNEGRSFVDAVRDALPWAGIPALSSVQPRPERELEFLRERLQ